jgi:ElaA protein
VGPGGSTVVAASSHPDGVPSSDQPRKRPPKQRPELTPGLYRAPFADLATRTWHDIVRLRIDVFVVEQQCPYPELDGRDVEEGTLHLWAATSAGEVLAYLRLLTEPDGSSRIGRVCVAATARRHRLAAALLADALAHSLAHRPGADVVLAAQSQLASWYARHGFVVDGPEFVEDGIPHLPMRLTRAVPPATAG